MQAGRLRHTVTLQQRCCSTDEYGAKTDNWRPLAIRRASIEPINGREYFTASGEHAEITTRIRLRYDSEVDKLRPMDRILQDGIIYDIVSVINPQQRSREVVLMTRRGYNDGC